MSKWDFCAIMEEASKYSSRTSFNLGSRRAYNAAKSHGLLDALFPVVRKAKALPCPIVSLPISDDQIDALADLAFDGTPSDVTVWISTQPVEQRDDLWAMFHAAN